MFAIQKQSADTRWRIFIVSAGAMLFITAAAKLISSFGSSSILEKPDPVFQITFRSLFWLSGYVEILLALFCIFGERIRLQAFLISLLATNILAYRIVLFLIGYHKSCSCLGSLTDAIHVSPHVADNAMKGVLAYLLIGSYWILFHQWLRRSAEGRMKNEEVESLKS